jgi:replicative DNA helicase
MCSVDDHLQPLSATLAETEKRLIADVDATGQIWPTGFGVLDSHLSGGIRAGELTLLTGPQGLGKTTFVLQVLRCAAAAGRIAVYFSFEHDEQSILQRLIAIEAGEVAGVEGVGVSRIRQAVEALDGGSGDLADRLRHEPGGVIAVERVSEFSSRVLIHRSSGHRTTIETIGSVVQQVQASTGQTPLVVVDYLQKVRVPEGTFVEEERITTVVEGLKDLALDMRAPVLAVVAADREGIASGKRMRVHNMRGSTSLAYEADVVLIMNDKFDVVARHHLVYNTPQADRFHDFVVISIAKNRSGQDMVDLEFRKRFEQGRFESEGSHVVEQLTDERVFID